MRGNMKSLTKGKPIKVILLFAVPLYVGQLFQLGYSLIDTRIIGGILGEKALAAVGATISLSDMLTEFLNGIICGFGIIISTFFGSEDEEGLKKAIGGSVVLGVAGTMFISGLSSAFLPDILRILNISDELLPQAAAYIRIILCGLLATTLYNICAAFSGNFQSYEYFSGLCLHSETADGRFRGGICNDNFTGVVGFLLFFVYEEKISRNMSVGKRFSAG